MISVVVVSSKKEKQLLDCLESIEQSFKEESLDGEIIVFLNHTEKVSFDKLKQFKTDRSNIVIIESETAYPLSVLKNKGVSLAKGKMIAFCDDDCTVSKRWASSMYYGLENKSTWVYGPVKPAVKIPFWARGRACWLLGLNNNGAFPVGSNMAFSKDIIGKYKFNENIGPGTDYPLGEDYKLALELADADIMGRYLPDMVANHHIEAEKMTFKAVYKRCIDEGKMLYFMFGKKIALKRFVFLFLWPISLIIHRDLNPLFRVIVSFYYFAVIFGSKRNV